MAELTLVLLAALAANVLACGIAGQPRGEVVIETGRDVAASRAIGPIR